MFEIIINILAIIGLIILISYLISYLYNYFKQRAANTLNAQTNPPLVYMQQTGLRCPDYWVNTGVDSNGNYICKNSYNLDVKKNSSSECSNVSCYSNDSDKTTNFIPLPSGYTWELGNPSGLTSYTNTERYDFVNKTGTGASNSRCDWIKCCGPNNDNDAIWQGISKTCNSDPSQKTIS